MNMVLLLGSPGPAYVHASVHEAEQDSHLAYMHVGRMPIQGFCSVPGCDLAAQSQPHLSLLPGYKESASPHCPVLTGSSCLQNCQLNICMQTCKASHKPEGRLCDTPLLQHQSLVLCESAAQTQLAHHSTAQHRPF